MSNTRWEHFEHKADIGIRGFGDTLAAAFEQAALAMTAAIIDPAEVADQFEALKAKARAMGVRLHLDGARLWDADGNAYLDYVGSWGPMLLGHAHRAIHDAVVEAAALGTSFGAPTAGEVELAERVVAMVPGIDMVRFVNSGTEAVMVALTPVSSTSMAR